MKRFNEVLAELESFLGREELEDFIARGWVRPLRDETDYCFEEIDLARIRLVCELHEDMELEPDSLDIVLSLMDQLYETRNRLSLLARALESQPDSVRIEITRSIERISKINR